MTKNTRMVQKQLNRRSERDLNSEVLTIKEINIFRDVANSTASSINGQGTSLVFITDKELKEKIGDWNWGQKHIKKAPLFILFLVDLQRTKYAFEKNNRKINLDNNATFDELLKTGIVDAAIKAQAIVDAALSMNMGTCYVGGVRTYQNKIIDELNLPEQIIPVLGLTVGHINTQEEIKPKMDTTFINSYSQEKMKKKADNFDDKIKKYYDVRNNNKKNKNWSLNTAIIYNSFFNTKKIYDVQQLLVNNKYKK